MLYLLDTNICIYIIKQNNPLVYKKFTSLKPGDVGISSVTLAELQYGVSKSAFPEKNQQSLNQFLIPLEILEFDEHAATYYGKIRSELERAGKVIGAMDMLIAAHALSLDVVLVSNNLKEFIRVDGLQTENWTI
jgi:tRNA(fMet)-specific endonuclease VapC